ncbi:MAG: hypothetical protein ABIT04_01485 [Novosphingobium sp.]
MSISRDSVSFWTDAAWVICLRLKRIAGGGKNGKQEAKRMVTEKVAAHAQFVRDLAKGKAGKSPQSITSRVIAHYGPGIRANRDRLSRKAG